MNYKRLLLATLALVVFTFIVAMLTCGGAFNWVYHLEPTNVWKPMDKFPFPLVIASMLITNLIFVYVYALINKGIPGKNKYARGIIYGLIVWAVGMIPGMIETYIYMTVNTTVIAYWTIWALVIFPLKGVITAWIYEQDAE